MSELSPLHGDIASLQAAFRWQIAPVLNMAEQVCGRHAASSSRIALIDGETGETVSFLALERMASRLAHVLTAQGIVRGDRVAVLLSQRVETAALHIAVWKLGAISLPLFQLFGPEALAFRLRDSGAKIVVSDHAGTHKLAQLRGDLANLQAILNVDGPSADGLDLPHLMSHARDQHPTALTACDDPAVLIYTSGTTGNPKGALHAHRVLSGHLPGVQMSHDLSPQVGDCYWTPADWAWIGGLFDVLMPALYFGLPVVMQPAGKFDPQAAMSLMRAHGVRNSFLPPTALRLMRQANVKPPSGLSLRSIASGGERLGEDVLNWARELFDVTINEFYGQTECNMIVSNCACLSAPRKGAMGLAVPGHEVAVVDEVGQLTADGEIGDIAVRRPDPAMFLSYWRQPEATAAKFRGDWLITGDRGARDEEGFFTFFGRDDDIIISAGYRIGPAEIEACLCAHPAVAQAAVIAVPDPVRGEAIQAHLVLKTDQSGSKDLTKAIQNFVKERLAAHEYPREIVYRKELPLTATGKIRRMSLRDEMTGRIDEANRPRK